MRNILKPHSGTHSGTVVSSKKYHIFDDFQKKEKILEKKSCLSIDSKKEKILEKITIWNFLMRMILFFQVFSDFDEIWYIRNG